MKVCKVCGELKPYSEFHRTTKSSDGYRTRCKSCRYKIEGEANRARVKEWAKNNPDKRREQTRKIRSVPGSRKEEGRRRYLKNKDYFYEAVRKRRARKTGNGGSHTIKEWRELKEKYGNRCLCCGQIVPLTEDHIMPLSKGGTDNIDNIQPLCILCNHRKFTEFIDYRNPFVAMAT